MVTPTAELLESAFRWMVTARTMEERVRSAFTQGRLRGRCVSGRGQEAIPVGAALALSDDDAMAPLHRDLGAHLVRGTTPLTVFRHYLGRVTGPSRGRDADLHMGEWSRFVFPMVSHLPDSWPVMTGVALGFKLRGEARVAVAFCGDGATSTGQWHEAVNFAAVNDLPMLLLVENNQFAYSTPTAAQYRCERITDRAAGYGIPGERVDGNDVEAVHAVVTKAAQRAREGSGPTLVELETMRMEGHAFHDDAGYVPTALMSEWAQRDPIDRCAARLRAHGWDDARIADVRAAIHTEVKAAWDHAEAEPLPDASELEQGVYAV